MTIQIKKQACAIARLEQSVKNTEDLLKKLDTRFDKLDVSHAKIDKKLYTAGVILTIMLALGGYIVNKAVNFGVDVAKDAIHAKQNDK